MVKRTFLIGLLFALIFGCSSNDGNELTHYGNIQLFVHQTATDTCTLSNQTAFPELEAPAPGISAGEEIYVTANSAPVARYTWSEDTFGSGDFRYFGGWLLRQQPGAEFPFGMTVNLPGAEFPEISNIPFPDTQLLSITSPTSSNITSETVFAWANNQGNDGAVDSIIHIQVTSTILSPDGNAIWINCYAIDDGNFAFPQSVRSEMGNDFTVNSVSVSRIVSQSTTYDDALISTSIRQDKYLF